MGVGSPGFSERGFRVKPDGSEDIRDFSHARVEMKAVVDRIAELLDILKRQKEKPLEWRDGIEPDTITDIRAVIKEIQDIVDEPGVSDLYKDKMSERAIRMYSLLERAMKDPVFANAKTEFNLLSKRLKELEVYEDVLDRAAVMSGLVQGSDQALPAIMNPKVLKELGIVDGSPEDSIDA
ncbi:hypothetical protein HON52_02135 [Candidatus Uhrbacteria bacterium]|jgi:hypothetical protein|nr:hypothetical protein [Candidatus Uhrbacteria bacterium]